MAKITLISAICFATGVIFGVLGLSEWKNTSIQAHSGDVRAVNESKTSLTNPLLECGELSEGVSDSTLSTLHTSIEEQVNAATKAGDIVYASVYFRDLNNGPWFGVNESDEFFPASLLKLPLAMSFYSKAQDDPSILAKEITYTPDPSITSQVQPFGPTRNVEEGKKYTVKQLIDIMLQESSNEAAVALATIADQSQITSVYRDLGLTSPTFGQDYKIDTHKYASFFRILFNATYLDRASSESILASLTDASFKDGLVAGVPAGITVAHKFGSRQVDASGTIVQLHDCGIIYAPKKPYLLCVMTQGSDFTKLSSFIQQISKTTYESIGANK